MPTLIVHDTVSGADAKGAVEEEMQETVVADASELLGYRGGPHEEYTGEDRRTSSERTSAEAEELDESDLDTPAW